MAYSSSNQSPLLLRLFGAVDDIFCMFQGTIGNVAVLKQQYGLSKGANEVNIIIEAYRTLRDRGPYPADQVVRDISGKFAFVLYDCSTKSVFMAAGIPLIVMYSYNGVAGIDKGEVCGVTYTVDASAKKETTGIPRVGSAADWSSQY